MTRRLAVLEEHVDTLLAARRADEARTPIGLAETRPARSGRETAA